MQSLTTQFILRGAAGSLVACTLALCGLSCSTHPADKAAGSEATEPVAPDTPPQVVPQPAQSPSNPALELTAPSTDPVTTESAPPTPESTQAALSMEDRVAPLVSAIAGAKLVFMACDQEPCTVRVQTLELSALHDVLTALSREFAGNIAFAAREQLDAYTGRSFQADVTLDVAEGSQPVPSDPNDLITTR
jgi:hypothetical protein